MRASCLNQRRYRNGIQVWNTPLIEDSINTEIRVYSLQQTTLAFSLLQKGELFSYLKPWKAKTARSATALFSHVIFFQHNALLFLPMLCH